MEPGLNPNTIPQFKSPEEELLFLRAHVAERERQLREQGAEANKLEIANNAITAYKQAEKAAVLAPQVAMSQAETKAVALALAPESHDDKMQELMGVLLEKGIKNALAIVEHIGSPHLDDDFHRFLVQYLSTTHTIPGLKEGTPLFKGIDMKLFEVTLPEQTEKEGAKTFKDFLGAMEQFYAGMQSVADASGNPGKNYFTLEIALSNRSDDVVFYAAVPSGKAIIFEKQVLGFYPDAKVNEVTDDYNIFNAEGAAAGAVAKFRELEAFPIKTYDTIEHDPMNSILNVFTKLARDGEGAAIQLTIAPAGDGLIKKFTHILDRVKEGVSPHEALKQYGSFGHHAGSILKDLMFGAKSKEQREKEKHVEERAVEQITNKTKSTIMYAGIRVIASAKTAARAEDILHQIESSFHQFTEPNGNTIEFERIGPRKLPLLLHAYSFRLLEEDELMALNMKELATVFHFPVGVNQNPQLKQSRSQMAPAPMELASEGVLLGINDYRGVTKEIRMAREDRVRHFYVVGQTGSGKTTILKNMIAQDIANGDGCCFIDPHGTDIQDILSYVPKERIDDVIYFDPAYIARPMGLNMLEYDANYPEQKTFVVNELLSIFNKLFDMKTAGGPAFEQYFRNSALLVMEDPASGSTLLEIGRVLADKEFRDMKLSRCKNPIIKQFWENAEKTTGEQSLANFVPYITNKFDVFVSNDIMRPVIAQQESVFNFRKIMDEKKILLVNLSKGRLGEINANLIGLILVGKIQMAALSRVDMYGQKMNDFYLYIDEFQNVTTDSIASILSEARKYRLSLNIAHQYIAQLEEKIRDAVFGNVGSLAIFRVGIDDAEFLQKQLDPVFTINDIKNLENWNAYMKMLANGMPTKPFNIKTLPPPKGNNAITEKLKELSYLKFGRDRAEVEAEIMERYQAGG